MSRYTSPAATAAKAIRAAIKTARNAGHVMQLPEGSAISVRVRDGWNIDVRVTTPENWGTTTETDHLGYERTRITPDGYKLGEQIRDIMRGCHARSDKSNRWAGWGRVYVSEKTTWRTVNHHSVASIAEAGWEPNQD